jgi:uncharacterized membrane protein
MGAPASPLTIRFDRGSAEFNRVLAFTDAVIAIAMTLLVLGIDLPKPAGSDGGDVMDAVGQLGDQIFAFVLSFVIIGFYWVSHHRFTSQLAQIDGAFIVWTLLFLLVIAFMPFEAQLIGFYSGDEEAVALYAAWFIVFGAVDIGGYLLAWNRRLFAQAPSAELIRFNITARSAAPAVFALSIGIALAGNPRAAMWSWLLIWPLSSFVTRNPPEA